MELKWNFYGSYVDILWMFYGTFMDIQWMFYGYITELLWMFYVVSGVKVLNIIRTIKEKLVVANMSFF